MNSDEYNYLSKVDVIKASVISIDDFINRSDRTLLYGYTCERNTCHVYIKNNEIITVQYYHGEEPYIVDVEYNFEYVPDKRLYPERCDFEFCKLLKEKDIHLPFIGWTQDTEYQKYYGYLLKER